MQVRFWGTRGSLPASTTSECIQRKVQTALELAVAKGLGPESDIKAFVENELPFWVRSGYGTNTACVEIRDNDKFVLCDAGTGLRDFAIHLMKTFGREAPKDYHILLSHLHWDHIHGFPFFIPAFMKGTRITFYGCHEDMVKAFYAQNRYPFFPVKFKELEAKIRFMKLKPAKTYNIEGFRVTVKEQRHPGTSYGYRFDKGGKSVVYATDSEHKSGTDEYSAPFLTFFKKADLLIFDAQYTLIDAWTSKEHWGHSNNVIGVEMARQAGVKHLCLFHMEPISTDGTTGRSVRILQSAEGKHRLRRHDHRSLARTF
jgi:phosphoribosyl 1,2-cyclic phosphodiesterase